MLALTLTVTPLYGLVAFIALGIFATAAAVRGVRRNDDAPGYSLILMFLALLGGLVCFGWTVNHNEQVAIDSMGKWTTLYRSVEDKHPVVQEFSIKAFLAENTDLKPMTGKDFTRLMKVTEGLGADDLIGFVKAPEPEKVKETKVEETKVETVGVEG